MEQWRAAIAGVAENRFDPRLQGQEKSFAAWLAEESGGRYTDLQIAEQMALMNLTLHGKTHPGGVTIAVGDMPEDGTHWSAYGVDRAGQQVWARAHAKGDPDLQRYIVKSARLRDLAYEPTVNGSNPGLIRMPDFVTFQIDYFVGSVWGTFSRDGNAFFGFGVTKAIPNPVRAGTSVQAGWLNRSSVGPGEVNKFLSGYSGTSGVGYSIAAASIMHSQGNGTATVVAVGPTVTLGATKGSGAVGIGNTYDQGDTGIRW